MERACHMHSSANCISVRQFLLSLGYGILGAGENDILCRIDNGEREHAVAANIRFSLVHCHVDREHSPFLRLFHCKTASGDQFEGVFQAHDPGYAGRCVFADAVANECPRDDAPCHEGFCQRILQREDGRLEIVGKILSLLCLWCALRCKNQFTNVSVE